MLLFSLEAGGCNFCFLFEGCSLCFKFDNLDCHAHTDGCNKHSIKDHTHSELTHSVPESGADFGSLSLSLSLLTHILCWSVSRFLHVMSFFCSFQSLHSLGRVCVTMIGLVACVGGGLRGSGMW